MRKKHVAVDHDAEHDTKIHTEDFPEGIELKSPKFNEGDMIEYRYNDKQEDWKPAVIMHNNCHNIKGECIYKIFSTLHGYREVHESLLFSMD